MFRKRIRFVIEGTLLTIDLPKIINCALFETRQNLIQKMLDVQITFLWKLDSYYNQNLMHDNLISYRSNLIL